MKARRLFSSAVAALIVFSLVIPRASALTGDEMLNLLRSWYGEHASEHSLFSPMARELLAKAQPDECFVGIGDEGNVYDPHLEPPCVEGETKVNQAYVWGLARSGDDLWFGTAPNVLCWVLGNIMQAFDGPNPHIIDDCWVCEFGESQFSPPMPPAIGDHRPARAFVYSIESKELTEKTPVDPRLVTTLGLRSAGSLDEVVIMGGPAIGPGGINLFAWNAATGDYLGSWNSATYNNIRKWLVVDGVLYTAVGLTGGGGRVLRWNGNAENLWDFEEVGDLDSQGAELAEHNGRLFVTTWPTLGTGVLAGLWMSPDLPEEGLTEADAENWTKIWQADDYEPDPVVALTYGGGALASFGDYLFWGTMHVPGAATISHIQEYGPPDSPEDLLMTLLGSWRSISIFRAEIGEDWEDVELAYGMPFLPVFEPNPDPDPEPEDPRGWWGLERNNMWATPGFGLSGFGNPFNNYTWTMDVFDGQLFVGTMDWSFLFSKMIEPLLPEEAGVFSRIAETIDPLDFFYGADLWRFFSPEWPALPESLNGLGNKMNYGIRTMVASEDNLYLGTANSMNLSSDGGWELIRLFHQPPTPTPSATPTPTATPTPSVTPTPTTTPTPTATPTPSVTPTPFEPTTTTTSTTTVTTTTTTTTATTAAPTTTTTISTTTTAATTTTPPPEEVSYYLAAGATHLDGTDFATYFLFFNPNSIEAPVEINFIGPDGPIDSAATVIGAGSRKTIKANDHLGEEEAVSAIVTSLDGLPLAVERSMYWAAGEFGALASGEWTGGHNAPAAGILSETWHLAEGATHLFDQFVHVLNPDNLEAADVEVTFVDRHGESWNVERLVPPQSNWTIDVFAEIGSRDQVSTRVASRNEVPVAVDRTMYWPRGGPWADGHASAGAPEAALTWRLAEGATHIFDCYLAIYNPSETETAEILIGFTGELPGIIFHPAEVGPLFRYTLKVNDVVGEAGAVAATVVSDIPVTAERAMYWHPGSPDGWTGGHGSLGAPQAATTWRLAEGAAHLFDCYLLIFNPSDEAAAAVEITFLGKEGDSITHQETVAPLDRATVKVNDLVAGLDAFSAMVTSDIPVVVERAMYWPPGGPWIGGHSSVGVGE